MITHKRWLRKEGESAGGSEVESPSLDGFDSFVAGFHAFHVYFSSVYTRFHANYTILDSLEHDYSDLFRRSLRIVFVL